MIVILLPLYCASPVSLVRTQEEQRWTRDGEEYCVLSFVVLEIRCSHHLFAAANI